GECGAGHHERGRQEQAGHQEPESSSHQRLLVSKTLPGSALLTERQAFHLQFHLDMRRQRIRLLTVIAAMAAASCSNGAVASGDRNSAEVRAAVEGRRPEFVNADGPIGRKVWDDERRFYEENGYRLEWSDGRRSTRDLDRLVRTLSAAGAEGLEPSTYRV